MNEYGIVMTTVENESQAEIIVTDVLEKKLAACIQEIPIKSHYRWAGNICHEKEILLLFKTKKTLYKTLEEDSCHRDRIGREGAREST